MASADLDRPLRFSVLDRLLLGEDDSLAAGESDEGRFREFVMRDIAWLLNTRQSLSRPLEGYPELQRSALGYGFLDVSSLGRDSPAVRTRLLSTIEETLAVFEPRLTALRVAVNTVPSGVRHQLRFVVHGTLRADPTPLAFSFDTVIDKLKGGVDVTGTTEDA
jgi:type VI secretion system lysozyme-like protein